MGDVSVQGGDINGDKQDIGRKGGGEGAEDGEEVVRPFDRTEVSETVRGCPIQRSLIFHETPL